MNPDHILDNLSSHLKNVIARAISLATSLGHTQVTPAHMICSMLDQQGSIASEILHKCGIDTKTVMQTLESIPVIKLPSKTVDGQTVTALLPELNMFAKQALEKAMLLAYEHGHSYIGTEHLLHGILHTQDTTLTTLLKKRGITKKRLIGHVEMVLHTTTKFPDMNDVTSIMEELNDDEDDALEDLPPKIAKNKTKKIKKNIRALDTFAVLLTDPDMQAHIDPVVGRNEEIDRLIRVLTRRTKNNPMLIGEPGVGKTAIVEGLARRISQGDVPDILKYKKIYSLDMALLISGTMYRGEFESRLKNVIDDIADEPNAILFIDELHTIIGAGANQGTMDAANMLKPALARGLLRCIGATTHDEYQKHIVSDPALARRFQSIQVDEPTEKESIDILTGTKKQYETHHRVFIEKEAIAEAVRLSNRYIHDTALPDKAIDILDEACAAVRLQAGLSKEEMRVQDLVQKIEETRVQKEDAIHDESFERAIALKEKIKKLTGQLKTIKKTTTKGRDAEKPHITAKHVTDVMASRLSIAPRLLHSNDLTQVQHLGTALASDIFGQEAAIEKITRTLKRAALRPVGAIKPRSSFLFLGPSGVGKTSMAKTLARALYHDPKALIQFDMSEFSEAHSVSKLLGSPAGYVGHKERNYFLDTLRRRPYSVILFDEIDKAHPDVVRLLLQILDEGQMTDGAGRITRFHSSIIILTSNAGAELYKSASIGFSGGTNAAQLQERNKLVESNAKEILDSALLARVDSICCFEELDAYAIEKIIARYITRMSESLAEKIRVSFVADKHALAALVLKAHDKQTGARNVQKVIDDVVHALLENIRVATHGQTKKMTLKHTNGQYELI